MFRRSYKIVEYLRNLKERFTQNGKGFRGREKQENFFEKMHEERENLEKEVEKYDESTYPNTYVWIEKFREEYKPRKTVIKGKKKG